MLLENCYEILNGQDGFGENWINEFDFSENNQISLSMSAIYSRANSISNKFYEKLN